MENRLNRVVFVVSAAKFVGGLKIVDKNSDKNDDKGNFGRVLLIDIEKGKRNLKFGADGNSLRNFCETFLAENTQTRVSVPQMLPNRRKLTLVAVRAVANVEALRARNFHASFGKFNFGLDSLRAVGDYIKIIRRINEFPEMKLKRDYRKIAEEM